MNLTTYSEALTRPSSGYRTTNVTRPSTAGVTRPSTAKLRSTKQSYTLIHHKSEAEQIQEDNEPCLDEIKFPEKSYQSQIKNSGDDPDYKDYLVKSIHKSKGNVSHFPVNYDLENVHHLDKSRDKVNDVSKQFSEKVSRSDMLLRLAKNGESVKKSLNQSFKYLKEATVAIKERDDKIDFLEKTIERLENQYKNELNTVVENWKGKVAVLQRELREKQDSEFERFKEENRLLREQLENIQQEKTTLEVRITEADAEFKEAHIKERKSKQIQDLLTEQIEKLKQEKGMNRVGLNKDVLISKMKSQIENLNAKKEAQEKDLQDCRLWAVNVMDMLKEERGQRVKIDEQLKKILSPNVRRKGGGYEVDQMQREEARMLQNISSNTFACRSQLDTDKDLPNCLKTCFIETLKKL